MNKVNGIHKKPLLCVPNLHEFMQTFGYLYIKMNTVACLFSKVKYTFRADTVYLQMHEHEKARQRPLESYGGVGKWFPRARSHAKRQTRVRPLHPYGLQDSAHASDKSVLRQVPSRQRGVQKEQEGQEVSQRGGCLASVSVKHLKSVLIILPLLIYKSISSPFVRARKLYSLLLRLTIVFVLRVVPPLRKNRYLVLATAFAISLAASHTPYPGHYGLDTCADVSIVGDVSQLTDVEPFYGIQVKGVTGLAAATHVGTLNLKIECNGGYNWHLSLPNTLVLPGCENLLCASDVLANNEVVSASLIDKNNENEAHIVLTNKHVCPVAELNHRYFIKADLSTKRKRSKTQNAKMRFPSAFASNSALTAELAHALLIHASPAKMAAIKKHNLISHFTWTGSIKPGSCYPCAIGKSHIHPYSSHFHW
jgi:hypothetical protein